MAEEATHKGMVQAIVTDVVLNVPVPYAVCRAVSFGSKTITFTLAKNVWREKNPPEKNRAVWLGKLMYSEERKAWRAKEARY